MKIQILAAIIVLSLGASAQAQLVNYVESDSGDLSGNGAAPTFLNFGIGQNTITGTMGRPPGGAIDRDIFTFTITPGEAVTSLRVLNFQPVTPPGPVGSFLAISGSNTINTGNPSAHLSNILVSGSGELLFALAAGSYSNSLGTQPMTLGLTAPLNPGNYTIWFQELSTPVNYTLGVTVAAVPEPSSYALVAAGLLLLTCVGRRVPRMSR